VGDTSLTAGQVSGGETSGRPEQTTLTVMSAVPFPLAIVGRCAVLCGYDASYAG